MDERYAFSLLDAYCWKFARLFLLCFFIIILYSYTIAFASAERGLD
jgi:hypothetical protein